MVPEVIELREWFAYENEPWRDQAACKGYPTTWWFPERGHGKDTAKKARAICRSCPVQLDCFQHALDRIEEGIWGNTSIKERQAFRTPRNSHKRLICQECRRIFERPALDSRGMRAYCSRACSRTASNRRCK